MDSYHDSAPSPAPAGQSFDRLMANAMRAVRRSAVGLTPKESQLLADVSRGRGFRVISEVADIARYRCADPTDATAIAEGLRGYILRDHPGLVLSWFDVLRYEGATNTMADEALVEHVLSPSGATRDRMVETHVAQAIASRAVADLIHKR